MNTFAPLFLTALTAGFCAAGPMATAEPGSADVAAAAPASVRPPRAAPTLSWLPEQPVQGQLVRLIVTPADGDPLRGAEGTVGGERVHFELSPAGVWTALAPIPIGTEGELALRVSVQAAAGEAPTVLAATLPVGAGDYRHEELQVAPRLGGALSAADQARLERDQAKAAQVARQAHATPRLWTAERVAPRESRVTSGFGNGRIFNGEVSSRHMGLDLAGAPGAPVLAPTRGVVALVDSFLLAGNIVYLNHGGGLLSGYFHLSEALVAEGDTVTAGTPIGRVGATGRVTGPHLHWVVRIGSTSLDPRSLLTLPLDATYDAPAADR